MIKKIPKILKISFLIIAILEVVGLLFINFINLPSQAASINPTTPNLQIPIPTVKLSNAVCEEGGMCTVGWIGDYIAGVYKYAIGVVGILAAIILMYGGIVWLTAGGNGPRLSEAKAWIGASISGLVLAMGSYLILYTINPDLVMFSPLELKLVEKLIADKTNATSRKFSNENCPTAAELAAGIDVYATGYYKPPYRTDLYGMCMIHMNCSCPGGDAGIDKTKNCDDFFPTIQGYHPCKIFAENTPYCDKTASGAAPDKQTIAASQCFKVGDVVCINGTNYTVRDRGSAINGRRIDIWSSTLSEAKQQTGVKKLVGGPCQ